MMRKATRRHVALFIWLTAALWLVCSLWLDWPGSCSADTAGQLIQGRTGHYNNWKPSVYSWMLGASDRFWPGCGVRTLYLAQMALIGAAVAAISHYYSRKHLRYGLLVLALPLFFTAKAMFISVIGTDAFAAACYLCFIACVLWRHGSQNKWLRIGCCVAGGLVLAVGLAMRHNAAPAVALLLFWACGKFGMAGALKKAGLACLALALMLGANLVAVYKVLEAEASYPLRSPFANDVINISILEGKWEPICLHYAKKINRELPPPHEFSKLIPEVSNGQIPIATFAASFPNAEERDRDYIELRNGWWETIRSHPKQYVTLKLFFFQQFLLGWRCIPWAADALKEAYPHIRIAWDKESRDWRSWVNREFVAMSLIPLSCYATLLLFLAKRVFRRRSIRLPEEMEDALYFIGTAMLYTCTFALLVVSVSEMRYYAIRASLTCIAGPLLLLAWSAQRKSRKG